MITPTLAEFFRHALDSRLIDFHTATIGRVQKYDAKKQTVDVVPQIKRTLGTVSESLPIIPDVPVLLPRANKFFVSMPLKPGNFVQVLFNERSIHAWLQEGREGAPDNDETHSFHGAVAIPGVYPFSQPLDDAHKEHLVIGKDAGPQIHICHNYVRLGEEDPSDFVALATKVLSELQAVVRLFNAHTHVGPYGPVVPASMMTPPASVAANIVKAS